MYWTRQASGLRCWFHAQQSNGSLRTGLVAGDFVATVRNPANSASSTPAVAESGKAGLYFFDVASGFLTTHGNGEYGVVVEIDTFAGPSGAPNVRTAISDVLRVSTQDLDTLATSASIVTAQADLDDIQTRLPASLNAGRMRSHAEVIDPGTITVSQAPTLDAAVSTRSSQASLDSLRDAVIAADLLAAAGSSATEIRTNATQADDFYNDLVVIVRNASGVVARAVTDYDSTNGAFSVSALPFTPGIGDRVIVLGRTASGGGGGGPSAAVIAAAVWDELLAGHLGAGSTGEALDQARDAAVAVDTRLPPDPADESVQLAAHTATQAAVAASESAIRGADGRDLTELAGAGWSPATDTLEEIRNAIDGISTPSVVGSAVDPTVAP